jgi:integrase
LALRTKRLDDDGVAKLKTPSKRVTIPDPECRGHYIRVTPTGSKSFWAVARDPSAKQHWQLIGAADSIKIEDARDKARKVIRSIRAAVGGEVAKDSSFEGVALDWFERHVVRSGLRSEKNMGAMLRKYIIPPFAGMEFVDVRRKHITALLDQIEDKHGLRQSDAALSILSGICGWYARRDEDYASPIIRGMKRYSNKEHARDRVLSDAEIRTLWNETGLFGSFTKLALLTGQRKEKLLTMRFDDVRNGVWHIPAEAREKGNGEALRLPTLALEVIREQRKMLPDAKHVLGDVKPLTSLKRMKVVFDAKHGMAVWWFHDLRRTARTIMAATGVPDTVAELVLGHVQKGIQAVYNRHNYEAEKAEALDKLAAKLADILCERKAA